MSHIRLALLSVLPSLSCYIILHSSPFVDWREWFEPFASFPQMEKKASIEFPQFIPHRGFLKWVAMWYSTLFSGTFRSIERLTHMALWTNITRFVSSKCKQPLFQKVCSSFYLLCQVLRSRRLSFWVPLLVDQWVPEGTCSQVVQSTSLDSKRFESIRILLVKIDWNCNFVGLLHHPFWLQLVKTLSGQHFPTFETILFG